MLNRVVLIGRLTKDPELRYTPTGVAVTNFTLAIDRNYKNAQGEKETDFIPCVVYRQKAEFTANYILKGKMAGVEGRIQVRSYTGQDGQKRWVTEVIVDEIYPLSPKDSNSDHGQTAPQQSHQGQQQGYGQQPPGYTPQPTQGQTPPAQGFPPNPPGQMPPPPSYQQQGQPPQQYSFGHQVNLDDDIPF